MATITAPRIFGTVNVDEVTSASLQVTRSLRLNSDRETVFSFLADHHGWASWFPILAGVELDNSAAVVPGGSGSVRTCTLVNGARFAENILGYEAPAGFGYAIEADNPLGLENHLAVVQLNETAVGQTDIVWYQFFDHPNPQEMVITINEALEGAFDNLRARFGTA